ncbi:MAG: TonB-dependent receptor plug domain-containing protein [Flavobacteriales bacterium]
MKQLLLLFWFILPLCNWAQDITVYGHCYLKGKKPAVGVKVRLKVADNRSVNIDSETTTNTEGYYSFSNLQKGQILEIHYFYDSTELTLNTIITENSKLQALPDQNFRIQESQTVVVQRDGQNPFEIEKLPQLNLKGIVGLERTLTLTTAATSNNELTSNYNVRGGNYDENLVYVNGFQVFRPFLTRSGQQEGMSFIHSSLVEDVRFSAGGFSANYGDRLSSVLDITYKTPDSFHASAMASVLGVETHVEHAVNQRFNFLVGARYRSNGYFLNTLPTKGAYNPIFLDAQILTNYRLNEYWTWSILGHFSSNTYQFSPQTSQTDFGTANEAYRLMIYFEGQEKSQFQTMMGGTSLKYDHNRTKLDFYLSGFQSDEREYFDILGQYFINELETDPSKEEFGDSIATLGVGGFLNHGRNRLQARIISAYHNGSYLFVDGFTDENKNHKRYSELSWGFNVQHDQFTDRLSEWRLIDSAGYSLPQTMPDSIVLYETIKGNLAMNGFRTTGYLQWSNSWIKLSRGKIIQLKSSQKTAGERVTLTDTLAVSSQKLNFQFGIRGGYTSINQEPYLTPRMSISYAPAAYMLQNGQAVRRGLLFKFSSGLYYQPPFYREFRTFDGQLNLGVQAQKSFHAVLGSEFMFQMWGRSTPFKLSSELYYKYLWDVNPYEIENVRTRYYANNNAVGYAYGLDLNVHGEFVEGIQSFFKLGLLSTKEDIKNDQYTVYYNAAGERIIFGYSEDQTVVDSVVVHPGYIPRPTDQWFTFGALVQDQMPGFEAFKVQMGLQFGSPLPYGPPDFTRYKDTLRMRSYFRVDLGLSYDLLHNRNNALQIDTPNSKMISKTNYGLDQALISLEIFNVLGVNNVLSKQWIQDVQGKFYAIPNYLTQRLFNLKISLVF